MASLFRPFNSLSYRHRSKPIPVFTLVCPFALSKLSVIAVFSTSVFPSRPVEQGEQLQVTVAVFILTEFSLPFSGRFGIPLVQ